MKAITFRGPDDARLCIRLGWKVFPVRLTERPDGTYDKTPRVPKGVSWADVATTEYDKARELFRPADGVGLVMGDGRVGLDVDNKHGKQGQKWWEAQPFAITDYSNATQSGGWHLFALTDAPIGCPQLWAKEGVDVRGSGGWMLAHEAPPRISALRKLPAELEALLSPPEKDEPPAAGPIAHDREIATETDPRAARIIAEELGRLDQCDLLGWDGQPWDNTTYAVACKLIEFANTPELGYSMEQAHEDFLAHAPTDKRFGRSKHEEKWASALNKLGDKDRHDLIPDRDTSNVFDIVGGEPAAPILDRFPLLDFAAVLDPNRPPRDWVVSGLITAGASVSLVAPAGSMKSMLALAMALTVARGDREFAGLSIPRQRRVLYVDMENPEDDVRERLLAFGVTAAPAGFAMLHLQPLPPLDRPDGSKALLEIITAVGLNPGDLLVLDSFQRVVDGPENDSDTYRAFYRETAVRLKQRGITVLRTDNSGKDTDRGARGSSGKRDDVDIELLLKRDGDTLNLTPGKVRISGVEPLTVTMQHEDDGRLQFTTAGDPFRDQVRDAKAQLDALGLPLDAGERKAGEVLDSGVARRVVRQAVRERKECANTWKSAPPTPGAVPPAPTAPLQNGAPRRGPTSTGQKPSSTKESTAPGGGGAP